MSRTKPFGVVLPNTGHKLCPDSAWLFTEGCGDRTRDSGSGKKNPATWSTSPITPNCWGGDDQCRPCVTNFNTNSKHLVTTQKRVDTYSIYARIRLSSASTFLNLFSASDGGSYTLHLFSSAQFSLWTSGEYAGQALGSSLTVGRWYDFVFTRAGNSITNGYSVYYDGVLSGQMSTVTNTTSVNPYWIGSRSDGAGQYFDGSISFLFYYPNYCLSASEVGSLYRDPFQWAITRRPFGIYDTVSSSVSVSVSTFPTALRNHSHKAVVTAFATVSAVKRTGLRNNRGPINSVSSGALIPSLKRTGLRNNPPILGGLASASANVLSVKRAVGLEGYPPKRPNVSGSSTSLAKLTSLRLMSISRVVSSGGAVAITKPGSLRNFAGKAGASSSVSVFALSKPGSIRGNPPGKPVVTASSSVSTRWLPGLRNHGVIRSTVSLGIVVLPRNSSGSRNYATLRKTGASGSVQTGLKLTSLRSGPLPIISLSISSVVIGRPTALRVHAGKAIPTFAVPLYPPCYAGFQIDCILSSNMYVFVGCVGVLNYSTTMEGDLTLLPRPLQ